MILYILLCVDFIGGEKMRQVVIYPGEDGYWVAECPSLPGCISQGKTKEEAISNISEAIRGYIAAFKKIISLCLRSVLKHLSWRYNQITTYFWQQMYQSIGQNRILFKTAGRKPHNLTP